MTALPPFLEKLQLIAKSCDPKYGHWSDDGKDFVVCSNDFEEKVLKTYFKGTLKTFIRQLHFYCFKKSEAIGEVWSFSHPNFVRDKPELIYEIKRKTRLNTTTFATKHELDNLREVVFDLKKSFETEIVSINAQLANIFQILNAQMQQNKSSQRRSHNHRRMAMENLPPLNEAMVQNSLQKEKRNRTHSSQSASQSETEAHSSASNSKSTTSSTSTINLEKIQKSNERNDQLGNQESQNGFLFQKDIEKQSRMYPQPHPHSLFWMNKHSHPMPHGHAHPNMHPQMAGFEHHPAVGVYPQGPGAPTHLGQLLSRPHSLPVHSDVTNDGSLVGVGSIRKKRKSGKKKRKKRRRHRIDDDSATNGTVSNGRLEAIPLPLDDYSFNIYHPQHHGIPRHPGLPRAPY